MTSYKPTQNTSQGTPQAPKNERDEKKLSKANSKDEQIMLLMMKTSGMIESGRN